MRRLGSGIDIRCGKVGMYIRRVLLERQPGQCIRSRLCSGVEVAFTALRMIRRSWADRTLGVARRRLKVKGKLTIPYDGDPAEFVDITLVAHLNDQVAGVRLWPVVGEADLAENTPAATKSSRAS